MIAREPHIHPVPIAALHPTQITVGMREVEAKRRRWRELRKSKADFLGTCVFRSIVTGDFGKA